MRGTLSVLGLYQYDPTIFDGWTLPEGVDLDTLKAAIFQDCAELETTLPDTAVFKQYSALWTQRKQRAWQRALNAMSATYNPIHNYDRTETYSDQETGTSGTETELSDISQKDVSAFNASTFSPAEKVTDSRTGEGSSTYGRNFRHDARMSGNIGVTTSQQMVSDELRLSGELDIYSVIVADFKKEFCLLIY